PTSRTHRCGSDCEKSSAGIRSHTLPAKTPYNWRRVESELDSFGPAANRERRAGAPTAAMETDLRAASSERQQGRPLRLLVVTSGPPVKRLPELFLTLLDAESELAFAGTGQGLPEAVAAHPPTAPADPPRHSTRPDS